MPAATALADTIAIPLPEPAQLAGPAPSTLDDTLEVDRFTRWRVREDGVREGESYLQLSGLYCAACADTIEEALRALDGVLEATVSAATQRAAVRWDPSRTRPSLWLAAVQAAGYGAVPDAAMSAREQRRVEYRTALWRLFVASFCAMQVMMFATPGYVAHNGELAPDLRQLLNWGAWVLSLPVMWFAAGPFLRSAWSGLRRRRIGMDMPVALGVLVTFLASTAATFDPEGPLGHAVYFDSLTMFLSFLLAGRFLELRSRHRAANELEASLSALPEAASRRGADGRWHEVSVQRLQRGDEVRVALGQAFPADGAVLEGRTQADEALLTGESTPQPKGVGAALIAGSVNVGSPVVMRVERVGDDTGFAAIVAMMRSAASQRPASARLADRWAGPFLWAVLLLAGGAALVWSFIDPARAVWVAVSVLVVTCPCALSLAAPATLVAAAGGLARRGVMVQRLDAIETLATVQRVFIDKTGTLTEDQLQWRATQVLHAAQTGASAAIDLQAVAASLAGWSLHPLSRALASSAADRPCNKAWECVEEVAGQGLRAIDQAGAEWRLGARAWVSGTEGRGPGPVDEGPAAHEWADARVWLGCNGQALAAFAFDEVLRPGAAEAVKGLQARGLHVTLLSGDAPTAARRMADRLAVDAVVAGATPADKLACIRAAQAEGFSVAMVGDGVNDAPVLACADVSLAMGQGALVARVQADAVVVSNRPLDIVAARDRAVRALRIVRQNLLWAVVYNAACVPLAVAGLLPPWAAGLGMASSSLLVVLNAARAAR